MHNLKDYDLDFLKHLKKAHTSQDMSSSDKICQLVRQLDSNDRLKPYEKIFDYELPLGIVAIASTASYNSFKICEYPTLETNEHIRISNLLRALGIAYHHLCSKKIIFNYIEGDFSPECNRIFKDTSKEIHCDKNTEKFPVTQIIIGNRSKDPQDNGYYGVAKTSIEYRECLILRDY